MRHYTIISRIFLLVAPAAARYVLMDSEPDYCSKDICPPGITHTMCEHPDDTPGENCPNYYAEPISNIEKEELLHMHNYYRDYLASGKESRTKDGSLMPKAANMAVLTWNDELAKVAQRWANQCHFGHDKCHNLQDLVVGQNAAINGYPRNIDKPPNMTGIGLGWYLAEVGFFEVSNIKSMIVNEDIGHFTQWIWAESYLLGCGWSTYWSAEHSVQIALLICNYGPVGNVEKTPIYKEGPPCSQCPNGTTCGGDKRYPNLCYLGDGTLPDGLLVDVGPLKKGTAHAPFGWHWSALIALVAVVRATL